jgi:hypothetical protein
MIVVLSVPDPREPERSKKPRTGSRLARADNLWLTI